MRSPSPSRRDMLGAAAGAAAAGTAAKAAPKAHRDGLTELTIAAASVRLRRGEISCLELTDAYLARTARLDRRLNAYVTVGAEAAREAAARLDAERRKGVWRGPLHGIPLSLKDNIDTSDMRTTAGSAVFRDRTPGADAEVARRLRDAGAVIMAKAGMHEFALGPTSVSTGFGPVRNPWAPERSAGGSSGGSGAAVAARLCAGSIGTDTGGSVRNPAAWCGLVGLKPSYGLVSLRGTVPVVSSLDHCGPIARTVRDAAILLQQMVGYDRLDPTSIAAPKIDYLGALDRPVSHLRIAAPRERFFDGVDPEIGAAVAQALQVIARLTAGIGEIALPATAGYSLIAERDAFHRPLLEASADLYTADSRARLASAAKGHSAYDYIASLRRLHALRATVREAFGDFDLVAVPTMRAMPLRISDLQRTEAAGEPINNSAISNGSPFNYYGGPAITVPCGLSAAGLPIGLTIAGPPFSEGPVLALAAAYEAAAGPAPGPPIS